MVFIGYWRLRINGYQILLPVGSRIPEVPIARIPKYFPSRFKGAAEGCERVHPSPLNNRDQYVREVDLIYPAPRMGPGKVSLK